MKHGHSRTRLYRIWAGMKTRCYNEGSNKYSCYGGRGITVCDEWKDSFLAFAEWAFANGYIDPPHDAGEKWKAVHALTIDRIDNDKGYSPENCQWISFQANRHKTKGTKKGTALEKAFAMAKRYGVTIEELVAMGKLGA